MAGITKMDLRDLAEQFNITLMIIKFKDQMLSYLQYSDGCVATVPACLTVTMLPLCSDPLLLRLCGYFFDCLASIITFRLLFLKG